VTALTNPDQSEDLSQRCFGFGKWCAPFWFIGPEQGLGRREPEDNLDKRYECFTKLESDGLCDLKEFHLCIGQPYYFSKVAGKRDLVLQLTWRRMILTLLSYKGVEDISRPLIRAYQSKSWGRKDGETCVVELSGLPARNLSVVVDRETHRPARLSELYTKIEEHKPTFVVVYGKSQHKHWRAFRTAQGASPFSFEVPQIGHTKIVFAPQPTAPGQTDSEWIQLGRTLRS
jgi:hypothetical protein